MISQGWVILIMVVIFVIGFIIGFYNWQFLNAHKDKLRHSIGLGIGIVCMFLSMLGAAIAPVITKVDAPALPIEPVIQSLHWNNQDAT